MNTYGVDLMGGRRRRRHSAEFKATAEPPASPQPTFIPLALPAPVVDGEFQIELQRAGTTMKIVWPAGAARDCAAWLREWLR